MKKIEHVHDGEHTEQESKLKNQVQVLSNQGRKWHEAPKKSKLKNWVYLKLWSGLLAKILVQGIAEI